MLYRTLCGEQVSALGFGCMRLPTADGSIDEPEAIREIHHAIDEGLNYIDTAYGYHGGTSEPLVGKALAGGLRDDVFVATKLPVWLASSLEDCDRLFDEQLERLQTDYVDFYMLHSLVGESWDKVHAFGALDWLQGLLDAGRIRHAGFSFHDDIECFKRIVDAWDWGFAQIQYNYMDEVTQAGTEGLEYAFGKGIGVVIMEPLRGGLLGHALPEQLEAQRQQVAAQWSPGQLALRWVLDHREAAIALSGMNRMDHVDENLAVANVTEPGCIGDDEMGFIGAIRNHLREGFKVDCTACRYCMPCPAGVNIPRTFTLYNDMSLDDPARARFGYTKMTSEDEWASNCTECGKCEELCPQHIEIIDQLKQAHAALTAEDA